MNSTGGERSLDPASPYPNAYVEIIEQPAPKTLRFRYKCEGRSAGSIPGANSTPDNKTYPGIQIKNCRGHALVIVSCVTKEQPYRAHPHKLVGKNCNEGICELKISNDSMTATFANLGIQCVKKKDIDDSLKERERIRVDPFRKGFCHATQTSSIDLNAVRLCFQVFLKNPDVNKFNIPLTPVASEPIYDKKALSNLLIICKLSECSCTVAGGKEIILLCEKVAKGDIEVQFFEENQGVVVWQDFGEFHHTDVHKQVAISFRTPKYKTLDIQQPVKCFIQLRRPSDGATSDALPFEYRPLASGWTQQPNILLLSDSAVKQGPVSPKYADLASDTITTNKSTVHTVTKPITLNVNLTKSSNAKHIASTTI